MNTNILIIDDDDFTAILLESIVGSDYLIKHCSDGESGLQSALESPPSLILMDVEMPVMNGYEACQRIKQNPETAGIPVIFLSAHIEAAERLAGYEAGGDDYVTKPFDPQELRRKIDLTLRHQQKNQELAALAKQAPVHSGSDDHGPILNCLRQLLSSLDFGSVADTVLRAADALELNLSLQLREAGGALSRSREGICSPLEESVLSNMASGDRIVSLGSRTAINFPQVTLIAKNMPRNDPELHAKRCDELLMIAESVNEHLQSLAVVSEALSRGDKLLRLMKSNTTLLRDIETRYRNQRNASSEILSQLVTNIEDSFVHLGLTENQENHLSSTLRDAVEQAQALYDAEVKAEAMMREMSQGIDAELMQEVEGIIEASAGAKTIELF